VRPIELEMRNFGPFINETIDFTELGDNHLFLISGKTGAGKTMLFDAMTYALYGEASTAARDESELRSHFAEAVQPTSVRFKFALNQRIYEISRSLPFVKPGNKTKTLPKLEVIELLSDEKKLIAKSVKDGNQKIKELIKMDANQFRQILILPQGEFKKFLIAGSSDKQKVLRTLFNSTRFKHLEMQLMDETKELQQQVQQTEQEMEVLLSQFKSNSDIEGSVEQLIISRQAELSEQEEQIEQMKQQLTIDEESKQTAVERLNQAASINQAISEKQTLAERLLELEQQLPVLHDKEQQYQIMQAMEQIAEIQAQMDKQQNKINGLQLEVDEQDQNMNQLMKQLNTLEEAMSRYNKETEHVTAIGQELTQVQHFYYNHHDYRQLDRQLADNLTRQQKIEGTVSTLSKQLTKLSEKAAQLTERYNANSNEWQQYKTQQYEYAAQLTETTRINKEYEHKLALMTDERNIQQQLEQMSDNELDVAMNLMRQHLHEGSRCTVCEQQVTHLPDADEQIISQHYAYKTLKEQQIKLNAKLELLQHVEAVDNSELQNLLSALEQNMTERMAEQATLSEEMESISQLTQAAQMNYDNAQKELTELKVTINHQLKAKRDFHEQTQFESYDDFYNSYQLKQQQIAQHHQQMETARTELIQLNQQINYQQQLRDRITVELQDWEQLLRQTVTQYRDLLSHHDLTEEQLPDEYDHHVIEELAGWIQNYKEQEMTLKHQIDEFNHLIGVQVVVELTPLQKEVERSRAVYQQHEEQYTKNKYNFEHNSQLMERLSLLNQSYKETIGRHQEIMTLAQLFGGRNPQKLTLENYVLTYYLEQTLKLSNKRLNQMTNYRYQFQRKTQVTQGYSGLEIEVVDNYSNRVRDISTLSGGETFLASLALALGLSDYVTQVSGGINLESVFIDEGFGTLDSETLETAIESLVELEQSGKMVGLISHVQELKNRITALLLVESTGYKSHTRFVIK